MLETTDWAGIAPCDGFVRPHFSDGTFDDPLPLADHFVELFLSGGPATQLVLSGPRGSGLTTALRWLGSIAEETGRAALSLSDVASDRRGALERLERREAILFLDGSVTPVVPQDWLQLEELFLRRWSARPELTQWARRLSACPLVLAWPDGLSFAQLRSRFENPRTAFLAGWTRDDLLELLGSTPRYRERRAELFGALQQVRGAREILGLPRRVRWLVEGALRIPEGGEVSLAALYANVLDTLSPWELKALRSLDRETIQYTDFARSSLEDPPADPELAASVFEIPRWWTGHLFSPPFPVIATEGIYHASLALPGLHHFLQAGDCLQLVAQDEVPERVRSSWFPFVRELITPGITTKLEGWLRKPVSDRSDSVAASILWNTGTTPLLDGRRRRLSLCEAHLRGIDLPGAHLERADLTRCDLRAARLEGADLRHALMTGTKLAGANLDGADLSECLARNVKLAGASLRGAQLYRVIIQNGVLEGACLDGARCEGAELAVTSLRGATFVGADLSKARFKECELEEARFTGASLEGARFDDVDLRSADLRGVVRGVGVSFVASNLAHVELDGLPCSLAEFWGGDLSSTTFREADLSGALFDRSQANEAVFDGADLRNALFRQVNFHAGSSRSGLLLDKPAREGSMTGYYAEGSTDDAWASPESIRQASFRDADLRGAQFVETDLFRVDFRGARLDRELRQQAEKAGAIL